MEKKSMPTILVVDDDKPILDLLNVVLEKEGFHVILNASNGAEALNLVKIHNPSIILLDVMLPDIDGFSLCSQIRQHTNVPILFLTAKNSDLDKLQGFSYGGDDYIVKPFNPLEVAARVKAQLKRASTPVQQKHTNSIYDFGHFKIDERSGKLTVNNQQIICPAQELKLLLFLCKHPNQIVSKQKIYREVWGDYYGGDSTVMVHIRRLREKVEEDPSRPKIIKTIRGLGYILDVPNGNERMS